MSLFFSGGSFAIKSRSTLWPSELELLRVSLFIVNSLTKPFSGTLLQCQENHWFSIFSSFTFSNINLRHNLFNKVTQGLVWIHLEFYEQRLSVWTSHKTVNRRKIKIWRLDINCNIKSGKFTVKLFMNRLLRERLKGCIRKEIYLQHAFMTSNAWSSLREEKLRPCVNLVPNWKMLSLAR